ncbi:hypothetical protein DE146DRAFT_243335 [Phaeosphaeria sp. MPI-PUGE-AT-0046c]|nr:hypothetical protein DE146DRAFT_243335 [Phaeosphaeria sp. MPI-PUGE-AT-0046c]
MGSRAPTIKRSYLERFVTDFKDKAVEILLRCCNDQEIEREILHILLENPASTSDNTDASNKHVPPAAKKSPSSQRTGSFSSSHRRQTSHGHMGPNGEPPSPPKSRSNHSKSLVGKDGAETIIILSSTEDDDIKTSIVSMKRAQTEYSVISEHIFDEGRIAESNVEEIEEERITIPRRGALGSFVNVKVSSIVELTWRPTKSKSKASHCTVFYLVPQEFLDIDVLIGSLDSGEGQALTFQEDESFHRSDNAGRLQPEDIVNNFLRNQQEHVSAAPRSAPATRVKQRGEASRTSQPVTAEPEPSTQNTEPTGASEKVRISCRLGLTTFGIRLDLDAHSEAFIDSVQKEFKKRKLTFVQADTGIWLKPEKEASDEDSHYVSLDEDDLEENWTGIIQWLKENKQANSNVMYGVFQLDAD